MTNTQLTHVVAQQRAIELREAAALARRGRDLEDTAEPRLLSRATRRLTLRRRSGAAPAPAPAAARD